MTHLDNHARVRSTIPSYFKFFWLVWISTAMQHAPSLAQPIRALWGYEPEAQASPQESVEALQELGANAVFMNNATPQLLQALHAANVKVYTTFNVFGDNSAWKRYPALQPMNSNGELLSAKAGNGICPTQRWYWPRILRALQQKMESGYDGIWLDFMRFSGHWEEPRPQLQYTCFCDSTLADFSRATGIAIPPNLEKQDSPANGGNNAEAEPRSPNAAKAQWILSHHRREWRNYMTGVIAAFALKAKMQIAAKPQIVLGAFVVPWQREEFGFAILDYLGQDYRKLREHIDIFSPMLYHELAGRNTEWVARFVEYAAAETQKPVLPIIQCEFDQEHSVSDDEFAGAILNALDTPSQGVIIFNYKALAAAKQVRILSSAWR